MVNNLPPSEKHLLDQLFGLTTDAVSGEVIAKRRGSAVHQSSGKDVYFSKLRDWLLEESSTFRDPRTLETASDRLVPSTTIAPWSRTGSGARTDGWAPGESTLSGLRCATSDAISRDIKGKFPLLINRLNSIDAMHIGSCSVIYTVFLSNTPHGIVRLLDHRLKSESTSSSVQDSARRFCNHSK